MHLVMPPGCQPPLSFADTLAQKGFESSPPQSTCLHNLAVRSTLVSMALLVVASLNLQGRILSTDARGLQSTIEIKKHACLKEKGKFAAHVTWCSSPAESAHAFGGPLRHPELQLYEDAPAALAAVAAVAAAAGCVTGACQAC
eukprot:1158297-Pelagomonas_calceolata.AAC.6